MMVRSVEMLIRIADQIGPSVEDGLLLSLLALGTVPHHSLLSRAVG